MLCALNQASCKMRKAMLKNANPELIKTISEICYNVLNGNLKLSEKTRTKLGKYKKAMRVIGCPHKSVSSKQRVIVQHGNGLLPILLNTLLPLVVSAFINK